MDKQDEAQGDPVSHSFMIAGELPDNDIDLDNTPTEEELHKSAEEEWVNSRSIGSRQESEEDEEGEGKDEGEDEGKDEGEDEGKDEGEEGKDEGESRKKKVNFKNPFEDKGDDSDDSDDSDGSDSSDDVEGNKDERVDDPDPDADLLTSEDRELFNRLPPEAQDSVEFWIDAERVDSKKYKGYAKKQIEYIKNHHQFVQKLKQEDPDTPYDENPKYVSWVRENKPIISRAERRRVEREVLIQEAEARVAKKQGKELEEFRKWKETEEREKAQGPVIQEQTQKFATNIVNELDKIAAEPMALFKETLERTKSPQEAGKALQENFPDEYAIITRNHQEGTAMAQEYLRLRSGISAPDNQNPKHVELAKFITNQEKAMDKPSMKSHRVRNGKVFTPADSFSRMNASQRSKHWTFSESDILNFLSHRTLSQTSSQLDEHKKRVDHILKRYGSKPGSSEDQDKEGKKKRSSNAPRHEGSDSPSSLKDGDNSGSSRANNILHFNYTR